MGGLAEHKVAENKAEGQAQGVRFHESGGEVHFHDDAAKLKCAVPVAVWFAGWEKIKDGGAWAYHDWDKMATVRVAVNDVPRSATITLTPITADSVSDAYKALHNFTYRRV